MLHQLLLLDNDFDEHIIFEVARFFNVLRIISTNNQEY